MIRRESRDSQKYSRRRDLDLPKSSKESSPLLKLDDDGDDSEDRNKHP